MTHRSHKQSLRDTVIGTVALGVGFYFVHVRLRRSEVLTWVDAVILGIIILTGLAVGYRDRLPLLAGSATKVIRARLSGQHKPPD